ncbi:MAG TPA: RHS repeat-associated core domain-containing protein [Phycisphaerales bacterium]|nr:RHS repeat-associated core domain-containing protein [Phycisphaerales bacterium]
MLSLNLVHESQAGHVAYSHVGLGLAAEVDYPVADVQLDRTASGDGKRRTQGFTTQAAGVYPGWDRFGRVARQAWVDGDYTQHGTTGGLPDRPAVVDLTHGYDRPGNRLTRYDGRPGARMPNWEFEYEYDGLDRLAEARRGSWDGSTFTAAAGTQEWALDLLGNWATFRHDRNGDGDFNDSLEVEDRTHNAANEVASAAIQGLFGSPFSQRHDHAGNWTRSARSGAQRRDYVHDAWNRLVKATDDTQPATVRGEYEYNGLHWRTVKRLPGSSVTAERRLFYSASWQMLEERIDDDVDEGFEADRVAQQVWGVRYIDDAVLRRTDANADGDYVDEGDRVDYYITDAQVSVVAVVGPTGALRERVVYSPYGEGRHHWPADLDGDGDVDSTDMAWYQNSANLVGIGHANYNPDADLNRDGVVGTQDIILALNWNGKAALASGLISDPNGPDSPVGFCGYVFNAETSLYTVRFRHYDPVWGRWLQRDPAGYVDGMSLYEFLLSRSTQLLDPTGLRSAGPPEEDLPYRRPDGSLRYGHIYKGVNLIDYAPEPKPCRPPLTCNELDAMIRQLKGQEMYHGMMANLYDQMIDDYYGSWTYRYGEVIEKVSTGGLSALAAARLARSVSNLARGACDLVPGGFRDPIFRNAVGWEVGKYLGIDGIDLVFGGLRAARDPLLTISDILNAIRHREAAGALHDRRRQLQEEYDSRCVEPKCNGLSGAENTE